MRPRPSRASLIAGAICSAALVSASAAGAPCRLDTVGGLNFGNYDPLSPTPLRSMGSIAYSCARGVGAPEISISPGSSGSYASRAMRNPADPVLLLYNLFTDASCMTIWGDGSSGTTTRIGSADKGQSFPVFGCLPALQDVAAGTFTDTVIVTFNF